MGTVTINTEPVVLRVTLVENQPVSVALSERKIIVKKDGTKIGSFNAINFKEGANTTIAVTESGRTADVEISSTGGGGGGAAIQFKDEGVNLGNNQADTVDFVGPGVTATRALDKITVTIPGGGGVQSVTGDGVDNADPANPVLSWPTPGDIGAYPDSNPDNYVDAAGAAAAAPVQSVTGTQVGGTSSNPVINLPPDASPTVKGITKLYSTIGNNIDGAVDQNTVKEYVDSKLVTGSDIFLNLNFY